MRFLRTGNLSLSTSSWIAETIAGAHDSWAAYAASPDEGLQPAGMNRNQCWFPNPDNNVLLCLGIHGQMVYVSRSADLDAAKVSTYPLPEDIEAQLISPRIWRNAGL